MSKKGQTNRFERIAFESCLREHPGDANAANALRDWLMEEGYTPIGARRFVTQIIREMTELKQVEDVRQRLRNDLVFCGQAVSLLMRRSQMPALLVQNIVVERGAGMPAWFTADEPFTANTGEKYAVVDASDTTTVNVRYVVRGNCVRVGAVWLLHNLGADQLKRAAQARQRSRRAARTA